MKFANYEFRARGINNLGDNMQLIAIDEIYKKMGIPKEEIVYIDKNDLSCYKGEYVILPVTMPLIDYTEGGITGRFSDYIMPVFIGLTLVKDELSDDEVRYYNRFEPIGCRDERTLKTLRSYGIQSYLHGCITASLPKRATKEKNFNKVFIVDISSELLNYIPEELKKDAVYLTHMHSNINDPRKLMQEYYDRYKEEAKLIITSLLHCAVPSMAAGIPVVLAKSIISYRFGWLEKLLPIYDLSEFKNIDWNPKSVEYEDHKEHLINVTINRLKSAFEKYNTIYSLSWFYELREKKEYVIDAFEPIKIFIDENLLDKNAEYNYSIWGLTQISELTISYMTKSYPNSKLMHVYDTYRNLKFRGINTESPEKIRDNPDDIIFVTTNGASKMAKEMFDEIGKEKNTYVIWQPIM